MKDFATGLLYFALGLAALLAVRYWDIHRTKPIDPELFNENGTYWPQPETAERNRHQSGNLDK